MVCGLLACGLLGVGLTEINSFLVSSSVISLPLDFVSGQGTNLVCLGPLESGALTTLGPSYMRTEKKKKTFEMMCIITKLNRAHK